MNSAKRLLLRILVICSVWCLAAPSLADGIQLPETCETQCITEHGSLLGTTGDVPAYSNCSSNCVVFEPNRVEGTYTGIKWQCVEYARRWLLKKKGVVYGDVDVAADIWDKIDHLQSPDGERRLMLKNRVNGSRHPPEVGDLLVYAREYLGTGHVAVVTAANLAAGMLRVAEENYRNEPWPGPYARDISMVEQDGRYWVLDPYLLGWKHIAD